MDEIVIDKIEWKTLEHEHKDHSVDWFWTIGLIALVSAGAAVWFHNYLFAIFIVISAISLIFISIREPQEITFSIDTKGIKMGRSSYAWKEIKSFNIKSEENYNKLFIETDKRFLPVYTINIPKYIIEDLKNSLLKVIPANSEIKESPSMQFMEKLGF